MTLNVMKQEMKLTIKGVAHETVTSNPRDFAKGQRELPKMLGVPLEEAGEMELSLYLAYAVAVRKGIYKGSYDEFCDDLDQVEMVQAVPLVEEALPDA